MHVHTHDSAAGNRLTGRCEGAEDRHVHLPADGHAQAICRSARQEPDYHAVRDGRVGTDSRVHQRPTGLVR